MAIKPITTAAELDALDTDDCVRGYMAGRKQQPDYTQRGQAYWHGYLNGCVDGGHMQPSAEQMALVADVVATGWMAKQFAALKAH